jgi:hypothetical protein
MSQKNIANLVRLFVAERRAIARSILACAMLALVFCCVAQARQDQAQQDKTAPAKTSVAGHYEGSAKNKAEEVLPVSIDLTEKDGAFSGMIHSPHGDFPITGGSRKGETVTIEFDAGGPGSIAAHFADDKLVGSWTAGEDAGSVEVKKSVPEDAPKGKS